MSVCLFERGSNDLNESPKHDQMLCCNLVAPGLFSLMFKASVISIDSADEGRSPCHFDHWLYASCSVLAWLDISHGASATPKILCNVVLINSNQPKAFLCLQSSRCILQKRQCSSMPDETRAFSLL